MVSTSFATTRPRHDTYVFARRQFRAAGPMYHDFELPSPPHGLQSALVGRRNFSAPAIDIFRRHDERVLAYYMPASLRRSPPYAAGRPMLRRLGSRYMKRYQQPSAASAERWHTPLSMPPPSCTGQHFADVRRAPRRMPRRRSAPAMSLPASPMLDRRASIITADAAAPARFARKMRVHGIPMTLRHSMDTCVDVTTSIAGEPQRRRAAARWLLSIKLSSYFHITWPRRCRYIHMPEAAAACRWRHGRPTPREDDDAHFYLKPAA